MPQVELSVRLPAQCARAARCGLYILQASSWEILMVCSGLDVSGAPRVTWTGVEGMLLLMRGDALLASLSLMLSLIRLEQPTCTCLAILVCWSQC